MVKKVIYGTTLAGYRIGESHHNAKLTDEQIDHIRDIYEEGMVGYRTLSKMCYVLWGVKVSRSFIADVCKYRRRACTPEKYKTVVIGGVRNVESKS